MLASSSLARAQPGVLAHRKTTQALGVHRNIEIKIESGPFLFRFSPPSPSLLNDCRSKLRLKHPQADIMLSSQGTDPFSYFFPTFPFPTYVHPLQYDASGDLRSVI